MRIGVALECASDEKRVAATPETVKKMVAQGYQVYVSKGAGLGASITDAAYEAVGAQIADPRVVYNCEIVVCVQRPAQEVLSQMPAKTVLIGMLNPFDAQGIADLNTQKISAFALEAAPRTTRAQSLDVLSSQANIAGYKAILLAANAYPRLFPMLMTAAGTMKAAKVVVLGVGVAGLQAIATAKRLGAVVEASDVRPSVKEQVLSLGAKFIDVAYETQEEQEAAQGVGGYARAMPASWLARQQVEVAKRIAQADVVVSTALIPGRAAPVLITPEMVNSMKTGSVIVDLAAGKGAQGVDGNCPLTQVGQTIHVNGVTIIGPNNIASQVSADASALYARNVQDFLKLIINAQGQLDINLDDDIVKACLMCHEGAILRD